MRLARPVVPAGVPARGPALVPDAGLAERPVAPPVAVAAPRRAGRLPGGLLPGVLLAVARAVLLAAALAVRPAGAQPRRPAERYDDTFRKYSKRYFGPAFDWRIFKAQGMAESNLDPRAKSWVGARGVMQLMPATFRQVASHNPELKAIDDPEMNIAAGIAYDRALWVRWEGDSIATDLPAFVFGSYNAGRRTLLNAQVQAREARLDPRSWPSIESVAPRVRNWRHAETLGYVRRIDGFLAQLDDRGQLVIDSVTARGLKR